MSRVLSYVCSDEDVLKFVDNLPPGQSLSDVLRSAMRGVVRGELKTNAEPAARLAEAKAQGAELDVELKAKKLQHYEDREQLKHQQLQADIELKRAQLKLSDAALYKLTAPRGGGYRYILAFNDGTVKLPCPHCGRTIAEPNSYKAQAYVDAKMKLVNHMADEHQVPAYKFDIYTDHYFRDFELRFFGEEIPACPKLKDYLDDKYFDNDKWPGRDTPQPLPAEVKE